MQYLIDQYLQAKETEAAAKDARLDAETALIEAVRNEKLEGTKTLDTPTHRVSVSNSVKRELNHDAYLALVDSLPENLRFVKYNPAIHLESLRHLEAVDPDIVAQCVTIKPSKPSVKIKEVKE